MFADHAVRKQAFLDQKKYGFYKVAILRFFQRETYDFRQKLQISPFFVFAQNEL